jgi:uncharacterized protein YaaN involved in tellurite resistance
MEKTISLNPFSNTTQVEKIDSVDKYFSSVEKLIAVAKRKHWKAVRNSYAKHKALEFLYKNLDKKLDVFIESYQGMYDTIDLPAISVRNNIDVIELSKAIANEENKNLFKLSFLQNQFDEINTIIYQFIYKWKQLGP